MARKTRRKKARSRSGKDALAQVRRALGRIEREGAALVKRVRRDANRYVSGNRQQALAALVKQGRKLGKDLEKRVRTNRRDVEQRAEQAIARLEKRLEAGLAATAKRLMLATQADIARLERRVAALEERAGGSAAVADEVPAIPLDA
jgi:hypothetical protein